jgi:hypothetical protein
VRGAGELGERERVHVVERRCDQHAVLRQVPAREARLHHPQVGLVREHHAFRLAGGAGSVEEHRRLFLAGPNHLEFRRAEEAIKRIAPAAAELDERQADGTVLAARRVAKCKPRPGVPDHVVDRGAGKLDVNRDRDQARAHDAEAGGEEFDPIRGDDRDPVAARETAAGERARDAVCHGVELAVRDLPRRPLATEVDHGGLVRIPVGMNEASQIEKLRRQIRHHGTTRPTRSRRPRSDDRKHSRD